MPLVQKAINGVFKGVSRQENSNRIEGQVEESINMNHTVEKGVSRRNPTELINSLSNILDDTFVYSYSRGDGIEEYIILIKDGMIRIFDTEGTERTVNADTDALAYLEIDEMYESATAYKAITVGDTTFIINRYTVCALDTIVDGNVDDNLQNPFYWVKRSFDNGQGEGYDYTLDGQTVNATSTTDACSQLATALGADYTAYGSVVVKATQPTTFVWSDSYGSQASEGFFGVAQKVSDLPRTMSGADAVYDFLVEVQGDPDNDFTKFWVKFEDEHWKETVAPALQNTLDNTTMPIKLVSEADGTFTLSLIDYEKRRFGDENTAPAPSFIGNTITDIFFFKNRLCFTSNENVIMSETAEYFNFFPTTVTDVLDSDPIDVAVDSNTVSILQHAVSFNDSVILFSRNGQFSLQSEKVLSPNDVSVSNTTGYNVIQNVRPLALGTSLYFLSKDKKGSALREYYVDESLSNFAIDVSGHVRGYIPNQIINMEGNTNQDIIFMLSEDERDKLYVYRFYNDGNERIQTSWNKWVFGGTITNFTVLNDYLYLLIDRGQGVQLERLDYTTSDQTSYLDNGTIEYESYMKLSEPVLKDGEGRLIQSARSPLMLKSLQLESTDDSDYIIEIADKLRTREAKGYAVRDNKVMLQGKSNEVTLKIKSVGDKPLEYHTYTFELNYNIRADVV